MFDVFAPAKINLFLHVTGKRDDGYHLLQSLMVFADAGDVLSFEKSADFELRVSGPFSGALGGDNIVKKAAAGLAMAFDVPLSGKIVLQKNLPVAAGLGGGSSDAAAALTGLSRLWELPENPGKLNEIAASLGADVPACMVRKPLWAEGVGEKIKLTEMKPLHLVLVNPGVPLATAEVFKKFKGPFSAPISFSTDFRLCRNDLTGAATALCPDIATVLDALEKTEGCFLSRMSGSGATCWGLYADAAYARRAVEHIRIGHPAWWVVATKTT